MKSNFKSRSSFFIRDILSCSERATSKYRNTDVRLHKKFSKIDKRNNRIEAVKSNVSKVETGKKHSLENANNHEATANLFFEKRGGLGLQRLEYPLFALGFHPSYVTPGNISDDAIGQHFRSCMCGSTACSRYTEGQSFCSPYFGLPHHDVISLPLAHPVYMSGRSAAEQDDVTMLKRCRRSRTVFTELQLLGLEQRFENQKYLSTPDRLEVAEKLGLSQLQVKTWYQNRRMKWKKQVMQIGGGNPPTKPKGRPKKNIDHLDIQHREGPNFSETDNA